MPIEHFTCSFNGINLSTEVCDKLAQQNVNTPILDQIFGQPWIYLVIIALVFAFVVLRLKGKDKNDPSTKPWWGRIVRKKLMHEEVKNRADTLGTPCNIHITWGTTKIGVAKKIEHDNITLEVTKVNPKTGKKEVEKGETATIVRLYYRRYGIIARIKAFFGFGFTSMILTTNSFTERRTGKNSSIIVYDINPRAHIVNDSGVWVLDDLRAYNASYELLLKADDENLHGSGLDMLRRLSVHQAATAASLERLSHEADIKRQEKLDRRATYVSGGN